MRGKLAVRNIKRSIKDYAIYFVTLVFGVAIFYAFNSIQSQSILFDLGNTASMSVFEMTGTFLRFFSIIIACVLGFLVIYANRFLIKRRKHEFGIYLTLGMKPSSVSMIVLLETFIVGLVSLAVGLAIGVALSQGLSFVTASLFNITMTQYQFVFSFDACVATLGCFAVIFIIVALFNTFTVRRYKLIELLSARSRGEKLKIRNPWLSLVVFLISLLVLAAAYILLIQNGLVMLNDPKFIWATILMIIGTMLFFYSLSGFVILLIQRSRGLYFRKLNVFTLRQISSKINTAFLSLSLVCIMLFFSITVFSCGMGMVEAFTGNVDNGTKYDATLKANLWWDTKDVDKKDPEYREDAQRVIEVARQNDFDIRAYLEEQGADFGSFVEATYQVNVYKLPDLTYGQIVDTSTLDFGEDRARTVSDTNIDVIGLSQFNELRKSVGESALELGPDEYAINNVADIGVKLAARVAGLETPIQVAGHTLKSKSTEVYSQPLEVYSFSADVAQLIVPDAVIESLGDAVPYTSALNIDYKVDRAAGDQALSEELAKVLPPGDMQMNGGTWSFETDSWPVSMAFTAQEVINQAGGMRMMITYLALYIGFVFLITTAAVLAIQQLSEASDSMGRYRLLSKLGCDRAMIAGSLRTQVLVYFLAPLVLAISHSICAIGVISTTMFDGLGVSITGPTIMTTVLVLAVYGSYLLITYLASRGIVEQAIKDRSGI